MKFKIAIIVLFATMSCKDDDNNDIEDSDTPTPQPASVAGLTLAVSDANFDTTYTRLIDSINGNSNITIIAEVNHRANASSVNLELRSTRIVFFGNPNLGTPLMQRNQLAGLDLPQKIVVYQDDQDDVYLGFNSTAYLESRHQLENVSTLPTINNALTNLTTGVSDNSVIISQNNTVISGDEIITKTSTQSFEDTYTTLKTAIDNNSNLRIIAEVNHGENASNAGLELRSTRLIIFGNPNLGTPLMQNKQTTAIDLPQKMLVWEDVEGVIKVSYNAPAFLKLRHGIEQNDDVLNTITTALDNLSNAAAGI